jgi:hypothetical protein
MRCSTAAARGGEGKVALAMLLLIIDMRCTSTIPLGGGMGSCR